VAGLQAVAFACEECIAENEATRSEMARVAAPSESCASFESWFETAALSSADGALKVYGAEKSPSEKKRVSTAAKATPTTKTIQRADIHSSRKFDICAKTSTR
jgi:hypothetical protein